MKKIKKSFKIERKTFSFEILEYDKDHYQIPFNLPSVHRTKSELSEPHITVGKKNFEDDLKLLVPKSIKEDFILEILKNLIPTVKAHYNKYGRVHPSDLQTYVAECVLISICIAKELGRGNVDINGKQNIFNFFLEKVIDNLKL